MTVVDRFDLVSRGLTSPAGWPAGCANQQPTVTVCWELDVARFKQVLFEALG
jgi:hypothetical protein